MKKLSTLYVCLFIFLGLYGQAPQKMSYQCVIRNSSNALVSNAGVGIKISILQGSESGPAVFAEKHSVTTNTNGLASLEIGNGILLSGGFNTINWAAGPYFIKTETDPTAAGGTNYTIVGTSELLSVPYALFAANSTPGPQGPQGPQGIQGPQGPIGNIEPGNNVGDMLFWNGTKWVFLPIGESGQVLTVCGGKPVWTTGGQCNTFYLGQHYQGGIIFYIDSTGQHGLIASESDQVSHWVGAPWGCQDTLISGTDTLIGSGMQNTNAIEAVCTRAGTAADLCANLVLNGYDDWYLPSRDELLILLTNQHYVGGFEWIAGAHYWSSTEFNAERAYDIAYGALNEYDTHTTGKSAPGGVRAIRSF